MKKTRVWFMFTWLLALSNSPAEAQTFPTPDYFRGIVARPAPPDSLPGVEGLRDHVVAGKLRLGLEDAVRLLLKNNTDVRINALNYESAKFAVSRTYQPFDPVFTSSFSTTRATSPTSSQLDGAQTLSSLGQQTRASYSQSFFTGTRTDVTFSANKSGSNSIFATFNPSITTSLDIRLTQPLLRNRGLKPNRAPLVIARRNLARSRADFAAQVNDAMARGIELYWSVVQARESLRVLQRSLAQAEATYKQNKRALELGALPPLDIFRSESQVATRRVAVIQAEYDLKQREDDFRRLIGADLDDAVHALDLELVEPPAPAGELAVMDAPQALEKARARRPELEALRQQLANDDTGIQLAHNGLQPDLTLTGFYTSAGLGGNEIDTAVLPPALIRRGGILESLDQLSGFDFPTYGFSLQLRLPLKNRVAEADLGNAMIAKRRSLYQLRQREQAITLEVRNAVHDLEKAKLSLAASKIARDLAQKNLEAEQRKYELGAQTIFFVLDAQTELAQAEQGLVQAEIGYQRALTSVDRATGNLLDRHQVQITEQKP